jgi:hypothetical protein
MSDPPLSGGHGPVNLNPVGAYINSVRDAKSDNVCIISPAIWPFKGTRSHPECNLAYVAHMCEPLLRAEEEGGDGDKGDQQEYTSEGGEGDTLGVEE